MTTQNWPDPKRPGVPMFPDHSARHVLENKKRRSLKLVLWDHEQEHYCTEIGWVTPEQMNAMDWEYYAPCLTPTQINGMLAAEREQCAEEAEKHRSDANVHTVIEWDIVQTRTANGIAYAIRNLGAPL
ncbi:hypothetical protein [Acetobacter pasteurianus]|uniref:hypothetical protein n=1 Tax=Acetobacter TaxID=434 RepID=UPI000676C9C7|nr:hypothetical protein [Acetobacter pasteurianus]AKR49758.1 hypothetical protein DB34_13380 [Acetobacter pasteurianus]